MKTEKESAITKKVMKTEKEIQEEVWKHIESFGFDKAPAGIVHTAVAKTIELTRPTIGIIRHEKIDVDGYKCGYEAALKELKGNVLKDSTATIIHQNGYEKGCNECADRISEIIWCSDTLDRISEIVKELTKK